MTLIERINSLNAKLDWLEDIQRNIATHSQELLTEVETLKVKPHVRHYIRVQYFTRRYK
jgi:hypothetical protein